MLETIAPYYLSIYLSKGSHHNVEAKELDSEHRSKQVRKPVAP